GMAVALQAGGDQIVTERLSGAMPSLPRVLQQAGYRTMALVPAPRSLFRYGWFFTEGTGFEAYSDMQALGGRVLDDVTDLEMADVIVSMLQAENERPLFIYAKLSRNHIPWHADKF